MSHVTCHVSRVMCHVSHVMWQSGEAYRWRVCYQWGLPRLVFLHNSYGISEFPDCWNLVGADWMENLRWAYTEPSMHFRETNMEPSMYFRKANTDPSMHFREANTEFLLLVLLTILLTNWLNIERGKLDKLAPLVVNPHLQTPPLKLIQIPWAFSYSNHTVNLIFGCDGSTRNFIILFQIRHFGAFLA